ncbi:MAG: circadian clock protein KaiA [Cyanobacteria bacterium P01_A01_bin.40]
MSDYQDNSSRQEGTSTKLQICLFLTQQQLSDSVAKLINRDRYELNCLEKIEELTNFVTNNYEKIDCLVLQVDPKLEFLTNQLWRSEIVLPTVVVEVDQLASTSEEKEAKHGNLIEDTTRKTIYHEAELCLYPPQLGEINSYINLAITKFISLAPSAKNNQHFSQVKTSLIAQQRRLTDKLKERLSYLGIYYKRNHNSFYRNLSSEEQQNLHHKLSQGYRQILLDYFDENSQINQLIDELVDQAFFADISTSQILEIHMELIDDFSHQLKIEGRKDDILLDYRLPLIDVISHLCEMYRRSIPGEDLSLELLFTVE